LNIYYSSDTYKELEARRKLGLKKPGEKVVRIAIADDRIEQFESNTTIEKVIKAEAEVAKDSNEMSNARKWVQFVLRF
jgi:molybdopterin synthase catalytic subunit